MEGKEKKKYIVDIWALLYQMFGFLKQGLH